MKINVLLKTLFVLALTILFWGTETIYAQVKIMPLGDSNTRGDNGDFYRAHLRQRLTSEAGIIVDYVGTGADVGGLHGPGPDYDTPYSSVQMIALDYDLEHEGWGGYQLYDITSNIDSWLTASLPDMILLMIGTNDLVSGEYQNEHDELHNLVSLILSHSPDVDIIVASIPPMSGSLVSQNELVENYNRYIPSIVNSYAQEGYFVYFADVYSGLDPNTDLYDDLHLNAQGYEKIADVWYDVIIQLLTGNSQPSVVITNPQDRSNFPENADILISADAIDTDGFIDSVLFYADGAWIGESNSPPHEVLWQSVPQGRYSITAVATDNEGFNAYSFPVWITVGELPPDIRFVVGDYNLNLGDQALIARLELMGYNVHLRDDDDVSPSDADGMDLVLVSSSVSSGKVTSTFRDVAVGVVVCESYMFDDMDLTGPASGGDYGFTYDQVQVDIIEDTHPIASGLSGVVSVVDDGEGFFTWGRPNINAAHIAGFVSDPSKIAVFAYEQGAIMDDGFAAPHRRVGMFLGDYTASHFTSQGWQLLDNAVLWALEDPGTPVNQAPVVDAGEDQTVVSVLPAFTTLAGLVTDDGLPLDGLLTYEWSSTDPEVTIVDPDSLITQVEFSSYGIYSLTLTGFDGELLQSDSVTITISDPLQPPSNLTYSHNPAIYTVGVTIPQNIPSSEGGLVESYSVDPPLPSGLSLDSLTGIVSGTPDEIAAVSIYTVTASNSAGGTNADLTITIEDQPKEVLLVVSDLALIRGDLAVKNHLEAQGYNVSVTTNDAALSSDALGKDLVVVSSTGVSSAITNTFRDVAVGVIVWEGYIYDDMDFTGPTGGDDYGFENDQVQVEILDDTHPIASGLSGVNTVVDDGEGFFTWGRPNINAAHIAGFVSDPSKIAVFAYEQGAIMDDGFAAPHRRVGMFLGDYTASHFTSQGWQLLDNAVLWALEDPGTPVNQAPVVDAGEDQTVVSVLPAFTTLAGLVTDDGLPLDGLLTYEWSSTDPEVTIVDPDSLITQVEFSSYGIYSLTLTGFDGELLQSDSVTITISDPLQPPSNLTYSHNPAIYTVGVTIPQNIPSSEGGLVESYSVDPPLPSGLSLDSLTGIVSGTPDEIAAVSIYTVTASNSAGGTNADLTITIEDQPKEVLLVVSDLALIRGDLAVKNHLEAQGYNVSVTTNDAALSSDALGKDLVVVSSTGVSSAITNTFRDVAVGVIVWEGYIYDDMDFTGPTGGDDYGFENDQVQVEILDDTHPIASGLSGVNTVVDDGEGFFTWGRPNINAAHIAGFVSDPSKIAVFAYEQGAIMDDGFAAPHRRVGMFLGDYTASHFTSQGWQLLDNAVLWALEDPGTPVNQAPVVDAGEDQTVVSVLPAFTTLAGLVTDDGLPLDGLLTYEWSSTDPEVTIVDPDSLITQVEFSSYGIYSLTLTGFDGELLQSDSVTITISDPLQPPSNLTYSHNPAIYTVGVTIPQNIPSSEGGLVESYSVDPPLPSGLSLDSLTGIVSGTPDEIAAVSIYTVTASNSAGGTNADLTITIEDQPKEVLLVVSDLALIRGDLAVKNHLEAQGYNVSVTTNDAALSSDALGKDLVVVSSTGVSSAITNTFRDVAVGVIVWEGYIYDDMDFTGPTGGDDYGFENDQVQVEILDDTHPIASGLSGVNTVVDDGEGFFTWGRPNINAAHIAGFVSDPSKIAVFAYEQGAIMDDGFAAPHRRVGMFLGDYTASHFTSQGWQLFDNAVLWALEII